MNSTELKLRTALDGLASRDLSGVGLDDDLVAALGLDSLASLRLLAVVEKCFGVRFPDERLAEFRTLRQLLTFIAGQTGGRKE
ncbi:MAG: acyl carrier protein [Opitutaceae bacterium]